MTGKYLIDLTDARFFGVENQEVIEFVRRVNPFAHTDVGAVLLELRDDIAGAHAYSPSYASCAYVVLHTDSNRIFGIAFDMRGLAFRLDERDRAAALRDGGVLAPAIGPSWVSFSPFDAHGTSGASVPLRRWCTRAFDTARSGQHDT
jgi:hypothetical protein